MSREDEVLLGSITREVPFELLEILLMLADDRKFGTIVFHIGGYASVEIAEKIGVSQNTARRWIREALALVRNKM